MARKSGKKKRITGLTSFLHPHDIQEQPWKLLPRLLLLAFALRAAVALAGDFVIHPDEIMQYLEPAHQLVFGAGVSYWEYFYGARSWLVPGIVAAVLWLCNLLGLDSPALYIAAVKLVFCALSLLVPWGMYHFARRHWSESAARLALVLAVFWYELAVFAHKPLTEFVATSLLFLLLAIFPLSATEKSKSQQIKTAAVVGVLCALITAVRLQYAPVVGFIFILSWLVLKGGMRERLALLGGAAIMTIAVGLLEVVTWGAPYHSYYVNFMMNLIVGAGRAGESSPWLMLFWWLLASGGLGALAAYSIYGHARRRGIVAVMLLLILIPHMMQNHREYRFVFAIIPLWLLLFADFAAVAAESSKKSVLIRRSSVAVAVVISILGVLNLIPLQHTIYTGFSAETGRVNFLRGHDPVFSVYRDLGSDDSVRGVIDSTRPYFNTGGYYYLHHSIPFYDQSSWSVLQQQEGGMPKHASHIITDTSAGASPSITVVQGRAILTSDDKQILLPAFVEDTTSGELNYWNHLGKPSVLPEYEIEKRYPDAKRDYDMILWRAKIDRPVRQWKDSRVVAAFGLHEVMEKFLESPPVPPEDYGIEFVEE